MNAVVSVVLRFLRYLRRLRYTNFDCNECRSRGEESAKDDYLGLILEPGDA